MIPLHTFYQALSSIGIHFFCGVPDSLLKDFCAFIDETCAENHVITANEGAAVALASGYFISTGKPGLVYMQNSGLGNSVNPLLSLADKEVYHIPLLLLIGWRGEPGVHDEPQHKKQGKVTESLLEAMEIPYAILDADHSIDEHTQEILDVLGKGEIFALLVKKGTFEPFQSKKETNVSENRNLSRERAIECIVEKLQENVRIVSTTGMISRELFEIRERNKQSHENDFLTVGSMGHSSQIALGIAMNKTDKKVLCLDGDGALLMHMGSLCINGYSKLSNLYHIVLNNASHDSVGGQPTVADSIDMVQIAKASGYTWVKSVREEHELDNALALMMNTNGPAFLEVRVKKGARANLGRPTIKPKDNLKDYMNNL